MNVFIRMTAFVSRWIPVQARDDKTTQEGIPRANPWQSDKVLEAGYSSMWCWRA